MALTTSSKRALAFLVAAVVVLTVFYPPDMASVLAADGRRRLMEHGSGRNETPLALSVEGEQIVLRLDRMQEASGKLETRLDTNDAMADHEQLVEMERIGSKGNVSSAGNRSWHRFEEAELEIDVRSWHWATWAAALLLGCCCCVCQGTCVLDSVSGQWQCRASLAEDIRMGCCDLPFIWIGNYMGIGRTQIVRREMRLMILYPLIPLMALPWTTCENGAPNWIYCLYIPLLLRCKLLEVQLLRVKGVEWADWTGQMWLSFALGCLEHADWFTDGVFPAQAYSCDPEATIKLSTSFEESWAWPVAPLIVALRLWGVVLLTFCMAAFSQQVVGSMSDFERSPYGPGMAAETCGMGALAVAYEMDCDDRRCDMVLKVYDVWKDDKPGHDDEMANPAQQFLDEERVKMLAVFVTKVFLENLLQLWLQSSFYGIVFSHLDTSGRLQILASISLGLTSALVKTGQALFLRRETAGKALFLRRDTVGWLALSVLIWVVAKMYFAHACASHLWNLTSGCVVGH